MESISVASPSTSGDSIPPEHRAAAARSIAEVARRDPLAFLGPDCEAERADELWAQLVTMVETLSSGPYARHGRDAIRIALARL